MVHYLLSWDRPADRLFDITLRFTAPSDDPRLLLPVWRPGRYLLQNYAANLREWRAFDSADISLPIEKEAKSSWRVRAAAGTEVIVRYRYYAGFLDAGSSFLDDDEAYFNGTNLFMMVEGLRHEPHRLTIAAPSHWRIETQLPREDDQLFVARDYDHLLDSPTIAAASLTRHSFTDGGTLFHLVFRGDEGIDTSELVPPVRAIAAYQRELFGELPCSEYRFLIHLSDRWHGVEHEDSCSIVARRDALIGAGPGDDGWEHLLSIISHELFHVWNVKRIVPARFTPYDYFNETPTRLLWVMEGVTSYYGELSLARSGIWNEPRYLDHLAKQIEMLESAPANRHLSLAQASFDSWLSDPAQNHDHPNAWFSFYNKGLVVAMLLDLTIRRASGGTRSLDDVMRLIWSKYGAPGSGLPETGFEEAVRSVADVGDFFERYVEGVEPLPYEDLLGGFGIELRSKPKDDGRPTLAVKAHTEGRALIVDSAVRGGPGMEAGLLPGDELIAINGLRTSTEALVATALHALQPGTKAELLIARAGSLRSLTLEAAPDPRPQITLAVTGPDPERTAWIFGDSRRNS